MEKIFEFVVDHMKILSRKIQDLDDVRRALKCLDEINEIFYKFDRDINNIVEKYALLYKFNIPVPFEEMERVEGVRYEFDNMMTEVCIFFYIKNFELN